MRGQLLETRAYVRYLLQMYDSPEMAVAKHYNPEYLHFESRHFISCCLLPYSNCNT
jgi:hypothetical protein